MNVTIYHNNACSNSRGALALIRAAGIEPVVIDYMKNPPAREGLRDMIAQAGLTVRGAMRDKGDVHESLNLADPARTDDDLLDAMMAHPALINRPFVVTDKGVRLCRPPATVQEIL
ncbi:arsenate reductase [Pseudoduganella lurida]|uniref:Arsenate reductase n=1 Tax=Pseudoduganella lurida TaxID=1036180 RepID=A0A562R2Y2_9BURK|nr:arsenate reductase (glutaredoxin) [Pseudoduganella lurida]TWI63421.1 arsenate reductase [Pseudoduganella lurida]